MVFTSSTPNIHHIVWVSDIVAGIFSNFCTNIRAGWWPFLAENQTYLRMGARQSRVTSLCIHRQVICVLLNIQWNVCVLNIHCREHGGVDSID